MLNETEQFIESLPNEIGNWIKRGNTSYKEKNKESVIASINFKEQYINFGTYIPCGCNFGKKYFSNKEELLYILENTKY